MRVIRKFNTLYRQPASRWFSSKITDEITVDPAVFERYDGSIVISGISGRFPSAMNNKELVEKLLNGEEMTVETKTRYDNDLLPARFGFLQCLDKFDANFFSLTPRQVNTIDPQMRLLMEAAFEAMIDAGMCPTVMRGTRTAVFSGAYGGEALDHNLFRGSQVNAGYLGLASMGFMIPGKVAFALDLQGPSSHMSTACSSSFTALATAVASMRLGECDAAIVTGSTVHLNPQNQFDLIALGALSKDGRCKAFDEAADGFTRAEAAVAMLIQKERDAKRNYARIVNIRSRSDGFKHAGVLFPSSKTQELLLKETYAQVCVDPAKVSYLEAHGTGTHNGDPEELQAAHNTFCKGHKRDKPLLVGSIKTNIGHTEGAAGLCGISKVIGTIQTGTIPKHLWFETPKAGTEHLFDGSLKIVTEPTPYDGGIIGISSFGIGGTNYHVILEPGPVHKPPQKEPELPILVPLSGRSSSQVEESIKEAAQTSSNPEFAHLLYNAYKTDITGHAYRGFGLLKPGETEPTAITVQNVDTTNRPVWIIFPGMGSQYNEMGKDLMKIEPFAESISRSRTTLKNLGIDLDQLLQANNEAIFKDIHHAVLSITAMQMALYDTIKELGLQPEGFIGHSTGEFLCAYADGCFTAEETLLVTDARGRAFKESQKVVGGMASVGLSWAEVKERLPEDLELACHNAATNVTVSGPLESVDKFVAELKQEEKFAAVVNSCGIAAHSKHVQDAADLLKKYVGEIIKGDRPRTSRWISTSIPEAEWETPLAKFASPQYFDNNLRAPVLFYEALQHVPSRSLVVEVSPKGFFQALLKETVPDDCVHVAPMTVKAEDKLMHFFQSVGQIYTSGVDVEIENLYPAVTTPVSSNTPSLGHLVKWDHEASWNASILSYPLETGAETEIDMETRPFAFMRGHKIENRILFPATAYLETAWIQYSFNWGLDYEKTAVRFTNVSFRRATVLQENSTNPIFSEVNCKSGKFQFQSNGEIVVTGTIELLPKDAGQSSPVPDVPTSKYLPLDKADIYKEFRLRGYNYTDKFQGIQSADNEGRWADLLWTGASTNFHTDLHWTSFLDTILQTALLTTTSRNLAVPLDLEMMSIDPVELKKHLGAPPEGHEFPLVRVVNLPNQRKIIAPGIEVKGLQPTTLPRKGQRGNLAYEKFTFCPFMETSSEGIEPFMSEMIDLVLENNRSTELKVIDVFTDKERSLAKLCQQVLAMKPMRESDVRMLTTASVADKMDDEEKKAGKLMTKETKEELVPELAADFVMLDDVALLGPVIDSLKPGGFLLIQSEVDVKTEGAELISRKSLEGKTLSLYKKATSTPEAITHVAVDSEGFAWIEQLQEALKTPAEETSRIYVTSQNNPSTGLLGLVNCLRKEEGGEAIRCIFDPNAALNLDFADPSQQLQQIINQDLATTVVKAGQVGSYRHTPLHTEVKDVKRNVERAYVRPLVPGDLSSLSWVESPLVNYVQQPAPAPGKLPAEKLYNVAYAAMNFRDVLLATGTIPLQPGFDYKGPYMGFEFSGFDEAGNRVMGITHGKGLATTVTCDPRFVWKVPDDWTLEQAATVPVVYATVLYAIHTRGRVKPGQTVLVHAGTGGVGQAAISVALAHGCTVFTTVGTPEKREFIKKLYPQLKDEHIGNSRDTSFEAQFMEVTNGRGVDVVLNSLAGDKLHATLRCLAVNGKFLEIGVFDAFMNTPVGLRPFLNNIEFHGITLYHILGEDLAYETEMKKQLDDGISSGAIKPLPTHVFEKDQVEEAFRFMAAGKHTGKLLLKVRDETNWQQPLNLPAAGRCYFPKDKTYVIVGGLGGLGLEVANWLVERQARSLVLISRSGVTTGYQSLCLRKWEELGVTVETPAIDLSDKEAAESYLTEISKKYKIGGIFNSALVLKDETFPNQTVESFNEVNAPKATVTQLLDEFSRKNCPDLDYFVVFSSMSCGRGNAEQTNYGWANAVMERICENRTADGHHGLAIQWGVVGEVGMVAEKLIKDMDENVELLGTNPQSVDSCLEVLDAALQQNNSIVSSIIVAEKGNKRFDKAGLLGRMEKIFGITDLNSLSPERKLSELGMDSLIAVELKQTLEREYDMVVTKELLLSLTVGDVKAMDAGTFDPSRVGKRGDKIGAVFRLHEQCLIPLKSKSNGPPVFVIHGVEGSGDIFEPLASKLNANVHAIQFTSRYDPKSITTLAEGYIKEIKNVQSDGPFNLVGYSGGATIAYEITQQLLRAGDKVSNLVLLDGCPSYVGTSEEAKKSIPRHLLESKSWYSKLNSKQREKVDKSITGSVENDTAVLLDLGKDLTGLKVDANVVESYMQLGNSMMDHDPEHQYSGNVVLIQATDSSTYSFGCPNEDYNVSKYCIGAVSRHKVSGDHWNILKQDNVEETASIINELFSRGTN